MSELIDRANEWHRRHPQPKGDAFSRADRLVARAIAERAWGEGQTARLVELVALEIRAVTRPLRQTIAELRLELKERK